MKYIEKERNKIISTRQDIYRKNVISSWFSYLIDCKIKQKKTLYLVLCVFMLCNKKFIEICRIRKIV